MRDKLIEVMAKGMCKCPPLLVEHMPRAAGALSALEAAGYRVVPVDIIAERDRLRSVLQYLSVLRGVLERKGMTDAERADKWRDHVNQMRLEALAALKGCTP